MLHNSTNEMQRGIEGQKDGSNACVDAGLLHETVASVWNGVIGTP